ncbi:uncharacterized protein LOC131471690 [Solea solea]|uniref:uncharacterized protein LOC131471690 n=1 Tax=Solea solea TaxID=90069 RepID=UPI002729EAE0|nr:uncharacterized protein LOC131471690 [Solea solea]
MSVSITKAEGVSVFTLTFDPKSALPPLCQIFQALCCSPVWCSVSKHLRGVQGKAHSVLGTLHIMVGLLYIGLGTILLSSGSGSGWRMDETRYPLWMGAFFIVFGIVSFLSEKFPSPCLVTMSVTLNMAGAVFAVAAFILYAVNMNDASLYWMCRSDDDDYRFSDPKTPSVEQDRILQTCLSGRLLVLLLLKSINGVLLVLSLLEFCVTISCVVLGIKALMSQEKFTHKITSEPELYKPLLEEVTLNA